MTADAFRLAATTNDLTREPQVRDVADILEFRMDKAEDPLRQLTEYDGELSVLATNRGQSFGGEAEDAGRLDRLSTASEFDVVEMVDVELEVARESDSLASEFRENDVDVVVSFHEFDRTPDRKTLAALFDQCARYGDVAKVATYAENYGDALRMLNAVHTATRDGERVAGMSMGAYGSHTRVVAPLYGSKLGYAPLASDDSEYAPGQLPIHELASMIETLQGPARPGSQPSTHDQTPRNRDGAKPD